MLNRHEREGTTDAQEYQEGLMQFSRIHILNLGVWLVEASKSLSGTREHPMVHRAMCVRYYPVP